MSSMLIAYETTEGHTARSAEYNADMIRGHSAEDFLKRLVPEDAAKIKSCFTGLLAAWSS
jgi:menaquinone-dependent protoporphyrinogen IX oxidase